MGLDGTRDRLKWAAAAVLLKLAFRSANLAAAFGPYRRSVDHAYGPDPRQRLDVYVPKEPHAAAMKTHAAAMPLVVFWHGGRWSSGDKAGYRFVGSALAELGVAAMVANYRYYPQVKLAGFMDDAARAVSWAVAHAREFGADPGRLYLMGHSAGAHIAALLSLDPRYLGALGASAPPIAGVIGLSGPYDFLPLRKPDVQDMFGPPELYPLSQPINFVHRGAPRMLLIHGAKDTLVSPWNSRNLAAALELLGVPVTLKVYPRGGHVETVAALSVPGRRRAATLADIDRFIFAPRRPDGRMENR
jgi:acetyl esterase/lipase